MLFRLHALQVLRRLQLAHRRLCFLRLRHEPPLGFSLSAGVLLPAIQRLPNVLHLVQNHLVLGPLKALAACKHALQHAPGLLHLSEHFVGRLSGLGFLRLTVLDHGSLELQLHLLVEQLRLNALQASQNDVHGLGRGESALEVLQVLLKLGPRHAVRQLVHVVQQHVAVPLRHRRLRRAHGIHGLIHLVHERSLLLREGEEPLLQCRQSILHAGLAFSQDENLLTALLPEGAALLAVRVRQRRALAAHAHLAPLSVHLGANELQPLQDAVDGALGGQVVAQRLDVALRAVRGGDGLLNLLHERVLLLHLKLVGALQGGDSALDARLVVRLLQRLGVQLQEGLLDELAASLADALRARGLRLRGAERVPTLHLLHARVQRLHHAVQLLHLCHEHLAAFVVGAQNAVHCIRIRLGGCEPLRGQLVIPGSDELAQIAHQAMVLMRR
mmetsp:Transcript_5038/g.9548  ORF Transcript_5038/g.9548 Transcript_5038/m.9548 type:complete len:443 (+) Transcript_5038:655-1983(+)